jgi:hypothetical protein
MSDPEILSHWMGYLRDDCAFADVVIPETHNSGIVDCRLGVFNIPVGWLNCLGAGIGVQLTYGVRSFDIRIGESSGDVYCVHGLGRSILLQDALRDMKAFQERFPSEFIKVRIVQSGKVNAAIVCGMVRDELDLLSWGIRSSVNLAEVTIGELRKQRRNFIVFGDSQFVEQGYCCRVPDVGTWNAAVNFGKVADSHKLYDYLRQRLCQEQRNWVLSLNRASGSSIWKEHPLNFMLKDREHFRNLIRELKADGVKLGKVSGIAFDYATHDWEQTGQVVLLNVTKGLIIDSLRERFVQFVAVRMDTAVL